MSRGTRSSFWVFKDHSFKILCQCLFKFKLEMKFIMRLAWQEEGGANALLSPDLEADGGESHDAPPAAVQEGPLRPVQRHVLWKLKYFKIFCS
jgi:hypothetical protein